VARPKAHRPNLSRGLWEHGYGDGNETSRDEGDTFRGSEHVIAVSTEERRQLEERGWNFPPAR